MRVRAVMAVAIGLAVSVPAVADATPGGGNPELVMCGTAGFYRNYNPSTDEYTDLEFTFNYMDVAYTRAEPYRSYGSAVRVYRTKWGYMRGGCLSGPIG